MSEEHAVAYRELRARVRGVVEQADPAAFASPSPATPGWTVHDLLAHLVGVADDVVAGRLEGVTTDPWTQAQVDKRRGVPVADVLDEWDTHGAAFEALLGGAPAEIAGQAVFDAATHEHDLRCALGQPGARDSDAVDLAFLWLASIRPTAGLDALRIVTAHGEELVGTGEPAATVATSRFEYMRGCCGRRTRDEIAAWDWQGDPRPDLVLTAPIFTMREESLGE